jgi:hypothetical protein
MSESTSAAAAAAVAVPVAPAAGVGVTPGAPGAAAGVPVTAAVAAPDKAPDTVVTKSVLTDLAPVVDPKPGEETKPGETKPGEIKEGDKAPEEVKPVEYIDFELPEGIAAEDATLASFREEAGKLGLTQEQAQALVTKIGAQAAVNARAQMDAWVKTNTDWQAEIKADPETGGDNFEPMRVNVARVFDDYCGPVGSADRTQLTRELLLTGAGNLPMLTKVMARIAAAHTEGGHVSGNPARARLTTEQLLYPTHNQAPGGPR